MRIAITGGQGFIGQNLRVRLGELGHTGLVLIPHDIDRPSLAERVRGTDFLFHLAGVNRPRDPAEFGTGNHGFTQLLCDALRQLDAPPRIAYASSTQAALDNPYGASKRDAEDVLLAYAEQTKATAHIYRLPNVFGKWSRPDYNSAVATFCHRIARGQAIKVNDASAPLRLIHVDDVVAEFCSLLHGTDRPGGLCVAGPQYDTTVGAVVDCLQRFHQSRDTLVMPRVGSGLERALYATYVSFLPTAAFDYSVARHADPRGVFVEMLKTTDSGQFGYFTAHPGITRGEHYHHAKTEKFLVIQGTASFGYRHIVTQETHEIVVRAAESRIVETVPGWTHNVTNIGEDELIVMVWANEIFDKARPDTIAQKVHLA